MIIAVALHVLAALIWVGGLFFILLILRPASIRIEPPQRFRLFAKVFSRYFPWVWGAIALLLITGYWMLFSRLGGFAEAGLHVHVMQALGIAMMLIFGQLYHTPYKRFRAAVEGGKLGEDELPGQSDAPGYPLEPAVGLDRFHRRDNGALLGLMT